MDQPDRSRITDSGWFWAATFSAMALAGILLISGKFDVRQRQVEGRFLGRQKAAEELARRSDGLPPIDLAAEAEDREVAVLSIEPSSPFTQGALLGDRIRLSEHFLDSGVFIRSMASRGALGGLAEAALQAVLVMDASGKDDILVETVGVGQGEIDIVDHADTIVLALMPGSGDSIQALKAGVMEIPDIIVVNKADHPMTETMVREVRSALSLSQGADEWRVPILRTEAARGEGVAELAAKIAEHRAFIDQAGTLAERRARNLRSEVVAIAASRLRRQLEARLQSDPAAAGLLDRVVERELDPATAATELLEEETDGT